PNPFPSKQIPLPTPEKNRQERRRAASLLENKTGDGDESTDEDTLGHEHLHTAIRVGGASRTVGARGILGVGCGGGLLVVLVGGRGGGRGPGGGRGRFGGAGDGGGGGIHGR